MRAGVALFQKKKIASLCGFRNAPIITGLPVFVGDFVHHQICALHALNLVQKVCSSVPALRAVRGSFRECAHVQDFINGFFEVVGDASDTAGGTLSGHRTVDWIVRTVDDLHKISQTFRAMGHAQDSLMEHHDASIPAEMDIRFR